jgi:hypothetical protein
MNTEPGAVATGCKLQFTNRSGRVLRRKQSVRQRGSTNTEPGAIATGCQPAIHKPFNARAASAKCSATWFERVRNPERCDRGARFIRACMHHASPLSTVRCFCVYRGRSQSLPFPHSSTHVASLFCGSARIERLCIAGWSRSLPPPQPGCPSGDPGSLPVPYSSTHVARVFATGSG